MAKGDCDQNMSVNEVTKPVKVSVFIRSVASSSRVPMGC